MTPDYGSRWRYRRAAAVAVVVTAGVTNLFAQATKPPALDRPAWRVEVEAGIEWACVVGRGVIESVLVAARDARLLVVNTSSGEVREPQPRQRRRGVRAAQPAADHPLLAHVAYVFDRHGAWAIRLDGDDRPVWRFGDEPGPVGFDNDPEALTGWTDARVTRAGLLMLNSDGRLVLLSLQDGGVVWQVELGRLPTAVLHTTADAAVVLWKAAGLTRAAFVGLTDAAPPTPRMRDLDPSWPIWSALCSPGLVMLAPHEVVVWPPHGSPARFELEVAIASATRAALWAPSDAWATSPVLLLAEGRRVVAATVTDGRPLWSSECDAGGDVVTLAMYAGGCLAAHRRGLAVLDPRTGRLLAKQQRPAPARLRAIHATGDAVYALYSMPADTADAADSLVDSHAELFRVPRMDARRTRAACSGRVLQPLLPPRWRDTVWTEQRMVLVGSQGLMAYDLP